VSFVGWVFFSLLKYLFSLGLVIFAIFPLIRFALIRIFEYLPRYGAPHVLRQFLSVPIVGILSRERHARRGDNKSLLQIFAIQLFCTFVVSLIIQSFLASLVYTLLFAGFAYWLLELS